MPRVIAQIGTARPTAASCERQAGGPAGILAALRAWRRRRRLAADLLKLDDRILADIGVDRGRLRSHVDGLS